MASGRLLPHYQVQSLVTKTLCKKGSGLQSIKGVGGQIHRRGRGLLILAQLAVIAVSISSYIASYSKQARPFYTKDGDIELL